MNFNNFEFVPFLLLVVISENVIHSLSTEVTFASRFPNVIGALETESAVATRHKYGVRVNLKAHIAQGESIIQALIFIVCVITHGLVS